MEAVAGMGDKVPLAAVADHARRAERLGFDTLHVPETVHDSLMAAMVALEHTDRLRVRTAVTLAFPRSPMVVALAAWDLAAVSGGRFELGLGTQIRQNIVGRYSVTWRDPVGRMREYVESLAAIWHAFATGEPLRYEGEHYRFDRLQPFFDPGPVEAGPPPIWLGGVNRRITELAGTHAAGFVTHPTNSHPRYLRERCLPTLDAAAAAARRPRPRLVVGGPFVTGRTTAEVAEAREHQRRTLAFLYSTPAYRRTLELFGWDDLGEHLQRLTRDQRWDRLADVVNDEVLDTLVPQATWEGLPAVIANWFGGLADGVLLRPPEDPAHDDAFAALVAAIRDTGDTATPTPSPPAP